MLPRLELHTAPDQPHISGPADQIEKLFPDLVKAGYACRRVQDDVAVDGKPIAYLRDFPESVDLAKLQAFLRTWRTTNLKN